MLDLMNEELMESRAKEHNMSVALIKAVEATRQWLKWFSGEHNIKDATDGEILMVIHHRSQLDMLHPKYEWNNECRKAYEEKEKKRIEEFAARVHQNNKEAWFKMPPEMRQLFCKEIRASYGE